MQIITYIVRKTSHHFHAIACIREIKVVVGGRRNDLATFNGKAALMPYLGCMHAIITTQVHCTDNESHRLKSEMLPFSSFQGVTCLYLGVRCLYLRNSLYFWLNKRLHTLRIYIKYKKFFFCEQNLFSEFRANLSF